MRTATTIKFPAVLFVVKARLAAEVTPASRLALCARAIGGGDVPATWIA